MLNNLKRSYIGHTTQRSKKLQCIFLRGFAASDHVVRQLKERGDLSGPMPHLLSVKPRSSPAGAFHSTTIANYQLNRGPYGNNLSGQSADFSVGLATVSGVAWVTCEALIRLSTRVRANCWAISIGISRRQATVA